MKGVLTIGCAWLLAVIIGLWLVFTETDAKYVKTSLALQSARQLLEVDQKIIAGLNAWIDGYDFRAMQTKAQEKHFQTWIWMHSPLGSDPALSRTLAHLAVNARYGTYILGLMLRESNFNPRAKSKVGALGLGQVRWSVWGQELKARGIAFSKKDLLDPVKNFHACHYILTKYLQRTGSLRKALYKYVGGRHTPYVVNVLENIATLNK